MRTAQRWGQASAAMVDDLVQETFLRLCSEPGRLLSAFQTNSPDAFYGYIKVVTTNVAHDYFRSTHSQKHSVQRQPAWSDLTFLVEGQLLSQEQVLCKQS